MKAYIEEGAWLVCSYDLAGAPQQLQRHLSDESHRVQHISGKRLLTVKDKNTKDCFVCKLPAKMWGGLGALVGGIVGGIAVIVSGPVGWAFFGAVVAVTVAAAAGGAIGGIIVATFAHDCAGPQSSGEWQDFHPTVTIKGESAILYQHSMLNCKKGGILIAFESLQEAQNTADKANNYAWMEIGLQVFSNALIGVVTGYGVYDKTDKDWDISTVPLTIASYYETDIERAEANDLPYQSALIGLKYTLANFALGSIHKIPRMPNATKHLGTEFAGPDIAWAIAITVLGFTSDTLESLANDCAKSTLEDSRQSKSQLYGKSVVSNNIK